jgi:manganese/iron transport system ATP-binding protein
MHQCSRLCLVNRTVVADGSPSELRDREVWMSAFRLQETHPILDLLEVA